MQHFEIRQDPAILEKTDAVIELLHGMSLSEAAEVLLNVLCQASYHSIKDDEEFKTFIDQCVINLIQAKKATINLKKMEDVAFDNQTH